MPPIPTGRIKIVRIITRLDLGGAQQSVLHLCRQLDPDKYERFLITGEGGVLENEPREIPGLRHWVIPELVREIGFRSFFQDLRAIRILARQLKVWRPLIVHTHTPKAGTVGRWAARLARVPLIVHTFHGFGFSERHSWLAKNLYLAIERLNRRISDELVVVASQHLEQGRQWGILSEGKGRLIRSGVDFSALKGRVSLDEKKVELGIGKSDRIVGVVASMTPAKSLDLFVRAARTIKDRCPEARFLMVGEGVLRPALESQIRSAGLGDAFLLLGWRRDVPEIIPLFDVALLTSRWEGVPKFLIEASALGVPTVAFNIDGVSEVIREGANGFLVNPENVTELARKALLILEDHALRERMGAAGRFLVEEFSAKRMVQLHETLYEELLEGLSSRGK